MVDNELQQNWLRKMGQGRVVLYQNWNCGHAALKSCCCYILVKVGANICHKEAAFYSSFLYDSDVNGIWSIWTTCVAPEPVCKQKTYTYYEEKEEKSKLYLSNWEYCKLTCKDPLEGIHVNPKSRPCFLIWCDEVFL